MAEPNQNQNQSNYGGGLTAQESGVGWKVWLFLGIILTIHIFDIFTRYSTRGSASMMWWFIAVYTLITLLIAPLLLGDGFFQNWTNPQAMISFLVIGIVSVLLPWIITLVIKVLGNFGIALGTHWAFSIFLMISAPWLIYLFFTSDDKVITFLKTVWVIFWVILIIASALGALTNLKLGSNIQTSVGINPKEAFVKAWDQVTSGFKDFFKRVFNITPAFKGFLNRNLNDTLGKNFMGEVDPYTERELGVQFTEVRALSSTFHAGGEVNVYADIQGENFKDVIELIIACSARSSKGQQYLGTVTVQGEGNTVTIRMRQRTSARCTFKDLPVGFYDVTFTGVFPFETWAYAPIYFAPAEKIEELWAQDLDPADEAGIVARPVPIYTSGPVNLGLTTEEYDQPIPVDPGEKSELSLPPFGASVLNQWADGELQSVRSISLLVPDPFVLKNCDHTPARGAELGIDGLQRLDMPGYNEYIFAGEANDANAFGTAAVCFLGFENPTVDSNNLLASYDLVVKTFAAKTTYLYKIKGNTRVEVQK